MNEQTITKTSKKERKALRQALKFKAEVKKSRRIMVLLGFLCAIALVIYFMALMRGVFQDSPFSSAVILVIAIIVGTFSIKATKARRRYEDYLVERNITKEDVKEYERTQNAIKQAQGQT